MPWIAPLIAAGASIGSTAISANKQSESQDVATRLLSQSIQELEALGVPSVEAQQIAMERLRSAGQLTPEMEQVFNQSNTEMGNVNVDPRLKNHQMNALNKLAQIGDEGGMLLSDKANLNKILSETNAQEKGNREAILARSRSMGGMGSGLELASQLQNQQASAQRASEQGLNVAAQAQDRALQSILQGGNLAGDLRTQDFSEQSRVAEAKDAINRFNSMNRQDVSSRNVNRQNDAQSYNLGNKQRIMDQNVGLSNQEQIHNKGLLQQNFNDKLNLANAKGNARSGQANQAIQSGNQSAQTIAGIGQGINQAASAFGQQQRDQSRMDKEDERYKDYMNKVYGK